MACYDNPCLHAIAISFASKSVSTFKHPVHHRNVLTKFNEIISIFIVACRHPLINYASEVSEVVYRHLEVVVGALKKAHIFALRA